MLLAAPGLPGDALITQQVVALARHAQATPAQLASIAERQRQVLSLVQQNPDNDQARAKIRSLLNPGNTTDPAVLTQLDAQINVLLSPGYRHLLADRPAQTLPKVHCPVLALNGTKDLQVGAEPNLTALGQGLHAGGNRDVTTRTLSNLNHLFQTAPTGAVAEYGTLEETFDPGALQLIADWVTQHAR